MKETVLITGANSFIAQHLIPILEKNYQIKLLTRNPQRENEYFWDVHNKKIDVEALKNVDYIVHLAGSKLNDGSPLTDERKQLVYESRIGAADFLRDELKKNHQKLKAFVSASAIGYYGFNDPEIEIDENGNRGQGFAADLSVDWEKAADRFKNDEVAEHVSKIRVSLVLGNDGGIFPYYKNSVLGNLDLVLKNDHHAVPWNHVEDMAGIFAFAVEKKLDGVYNSVAPQPATQQDIFKAIANNAHSGKNFKIEPYFGKHLVSKKIQNEGFKFKFPNIEVAIENLMK